MSGPGINEETRPLIEPADFHLPTTASLTRRRMSPPTVAAIKSPGKDRCTTTPKAYQRTISKPPSLQQEDRNAFDESFAAALSRPYATYDGQFDNEEYGDQTPLLNAYYNNKPVKSTSFQPSRHAPLEPASKSKPSRSICLWNEVSHNSQYTRPAAEILREVLEDRYPAAVHAAHAAHRNIAAEEQAGGADRWRWWKRVMRRRPTA